LFAAFEVQNVALFVHPFSPRIPLFLFATVFWLILLALAFATHISALHTRP
jgi:hypothetical protein